MSAPSPGAGEAGAMRELVREQGLLSGPRVVVVMLSGGRDSVCLLDLAVALRGPQQVTALHVNYGLREASDEDERHCARLCDALGAQLSVVRAGSIAAGEGRAGAEEAHAAHAEPRGNVQAWAREVRYDAAGQLAERSGATIASGHTASDQVETILYRLAASPGRRALLGMNAADSTPSGQALVRPLLGFTRGQTTAYCQERGLRWREDASNASPRYARSRVRLGLLPALRAVHPAAEANVLRTARLLREEAILLDSLVQPELDSADGIALQRLEQLPAPLARLVVVRLAEQAAGTYVPQAGARVEELLELGRRGGRAELHLGGGAGAVIEHGRLRMVKLPPRAGEGSRGVGATRLRPVASSARALHEPEVGEVLVSADQLQRRVVELGEEISRDYAGRSLLLVGVLKGAMFFLSDLMRFIDIPVEVDFMAVASYGSATDSSGVVRILKDLDAAIAGRDVLIVEDIVDSGLTLQYLIRNLGSRDPNSLEVCALLTKPDRRKVDLPTRYVGFEIPNRFVVGYGLDFEERHRNLPYVAALAR